MADNKVNFLRGTSAEYEASAKDNDTFYYTTDDEKLYLGNKEITGDGVAVDDSLSDISNNPVQNKVVKAALDNKADLSDIPTELPANGGDANTVDGKHASDFMQNLGYLTTGSLLDYVLTLTSSGSFFIGSNVTDTPISGLFYGVDVIRHAGGDYVITATRFNSGGVWTNRYNAGSKKWYGWSNVADGGNADTLDGKHASDFSQIINLGNTSTDTKTAIGIQYKTTTYWCSKWTDYPAGLKDGQGIIIAVNYKGSGTTGTDSIWCRQIYVSPHNSKIYQRIIVGTTVGEWVSISDLGYHFDDRTQITSGDLNTITTQGQFVVTSATITDTLANQPWTTSGYYLDVYRRSTDIITQIALRWDGKIALRSLNGTTWRTWVNIADGGNANTVDGKHASDFTLSYIMNNKPLVTSILPLEKTVRLTWLPVDGATKYAVSLYIDGKYVQQSTSITNTYYDIQGLTPGTVYLALVQAYVNGSWSKFTTDDLVHFYTLPVASATSDGLVTRSSQTFAGNKTFKGQVIPAGASEVGTAQARKIYAGTSDMTAGTTALETGAIYLVYE